MSFVSRKYHEGPAKHNNDGLLFVITQSLEQIPWDPRDAYFHTFSCKLQLCQNIHRVHNAGAQRAGFDTVIRATWCLLAELCSTNTNTAR